VRKINSSPIQGNPKSPALLSKIVRSVERGADKKTGPIIAHILVVFGKKKPMSSLADLHMMTKVWQLWMSAAIVAIRIKKQNYERCKRSCNPDCFQSHVMESAIVPDFKQQLT
jgi:hypothetical protein